MSNINSIAQPEAINTRIVVRSNNFPDISSRQKSLMIKKCLDWHAKYISLSALLPIHSIQLFFYLTGPGFIDIILNTNVLGRNILPHFTLLPPNIAPIEQLKSDEELDKDS